MERVLRVLFGVGVILGGVGLPAIAGPATRASACTGPPSHQQMAVSGVIFEGRITSARENVAESDSTYIAFDLTVAVQVRHKGAAAGEELRLTAQVPRPGIPLMCPQWDRGETFERKYVVGATGTDESGRRGLSRWSSVFLGPEPVGEEYVAASRIARVAAGGGPDLPSLTATMARRECGAPGIIRGSRFAPNSSVILFYPGSFHEQEGGHPVVAVGSDGRFEHRFAAPKDYCLPEEPNPFAFVDAYPYLGPGGIGGFPLAMAQLTVGDLAPGPPDTGNSGPVDAHPTTSMDGRTLAGRFAVMLAGGAAAWLLLKRTRDSDVM